VNSEKFVMAAYRAILRREPSKQEVSRMKLKVLSGPQSSFHILRDMVDSEEFKIQILPGLVVQQTEFHSHPVFFLHIPKTGGTSMRELIGAALGVPSINIYKAWRNPSKGNEFWPYWAGHAQISFFPETHTGITFFRDTKSRILSMYRQQQGETALDIQIQHGWSFPKEIRKRKEIMPFSSWAERMETSGIRSLEFYLAENKNVIDKVRNKHQALELRNTDFLDRKILLERGLARIASAAWIHKEEDVRGAITSVVGKEVETLPRNNTFESKVFTGSGISLTASDREILRTFEQRDELAFKVAADLGLIQLLPEDEKQYLFEKTASRLMFNL
jgi:hypothetical protein